MIIGFANEVLPVVDKDEVVVGGAFILGETEIELLLVVLKDPVDRPRGLKLRTVCLTHMLVIA